MNHASHTPDSPKVGASQRRWEAQTEERQANVLSDAYLHSPNHSIMQRHLLGSQGIRSGSVQVSVSEPEAGEHMTLQSSPGDRTVNTWIVLLR